MTSRQGYEGNGQYVSGVHCAAAVFLNHHQFLMGIGKTHGYNQSSVRFELIQEGLRNIGSRGCHDDTVEWPLFRPAEVSIPQPCFYIRVTQSAQSPTRLC